MVNTGRRRADDELYAASVRFFERGWLSEDSVFTPGVPVWTASHFGELQRAFVEDEDVSGDSFEDKLRRQLATCSDGATQLMAELLALHLLITVMISPEKKQQTVENVLAMMSNPVAVPKDVLAAFRHGAVNPGTYFNTGRFALMSYLIRVVGHWKALPPADREAAGSDPWRTKEQLHTFEVGGASSQAHALLHLWFPDTFEAIVSDNHFTKLTTHYAELTDPETTDPDRKLLEIRAALEPELGVDFDFYDDRIRALWEQGIDPWPDLIRWASKIYESPHFDEEERDYKLSVAEPMVEAVAAMEAGEDWQKLMIASLRHSANNLPSWQAVDSFVKWCGADYEKASDAIHALWFGSADLLVRVEEFSESVADGLSTPGNRTSVASFLLMGLGPTDYPFYKPTPVEKIRGLLGRKSRKPNEAERYAQLLGLCDEFIAEGAERGLALRDRLDAQGLIWSITSSQVDTRVLEGWSEDDVRGFFAWRGDEPADEVGSEDKREVSSGKKGSADSVDWLQVAARATHLPVSYLEGLRSLLADKGQLVLYGPPGTGKTFVALELAAALCEGDQRRFDLVQFHPSTTYEDFFEGIRPTTDAKGRMHYDVRPGPLARFAEMAESNPEQTYVLVIDELNRANLPKVLGEMLFLLEYRDRSALTLYRPEAPFRLPPNLKFIATMNTVDRSVAIIDAAMRRRFHFVPFYPDREPIGDVLTSVCADDEGWVAELVAAVNQELVEAFASRDHQLGASHFIRATRTVEGIRQVWEHSIEPLIEDQFFGQGERVSPFRWASLIRRHADLMPGFVGGSVAVGVEES